MKKSCLKAVWGVIALMLISTGCMPPDADVLGPQYRPQETPGFAYVQTPEPTASPTAVPTAKPTPQPTATPEPTATPVPTPEPEFALHTVLQGGFAQPRVENCPAQDAVNEILEGYYGQWGTWLSQAKEAGYVTQLSYASSLQEEGTGRLCTLYAKIESTDGVYALPRVLFDPDSGEFEELILPEHAGFADADYVKSVVTLQSCGMDPDILSDPQEMLTRESMFAQLLAVYTHLTGNEVSGEGSELGDTATAGAAILGLITPAQARAFAQEAASGGETYGIEAQFLTGVLANLSKIVQEERYGLREDPVSMTQLYAAAQTALADWAIAADVKDTEAWMEAAQVMNAPLTLMQESADGIFRTEAAALYVTLYESTFGEIDEVQWSNLPDTQDVAARKAYGMYLMQALPGSRYFSADYRPGIAELYDYTAHFVSGYTMRFARENREVEAKPLTRGALMQVLSRLILRHDARARKDVEYTVVDNSRDHEWYVNQYDGTAYASMNCMPAITCMTLSWLDPEYEGTPADIRAQVGVDGAWKMRQVESVLQKENVKYTSRRLSVNRMREDLDAGRILLVQIHEGSLAQNGHCLVVYGYETFGNSVHFFVHDPGYSTRTDLFGEPLGKGREMSSSYLMLISTRFVSNYLAVER